MSINKDDKKIKLIDFSNRKPGIYTLDILKKDWGNSSDKWLNGIHEGRARIIEDEMFLNNKDVKKKVLECKYPAGKFCPQEGGVQWKSHISPKDEYFLEYKLKFSENFEWVMGGKLPGLAGGSTPTGGFGKKDGFSSRYMWRANGVYELYLYWSGQAAKYGDMIRPNIKFKRGDWHILKQYIKLNTPGEENGIMKLYFDNKEIYRKDDFRFRLSRANWQINYFLFSTFYGGNTIEWAPKKENSIAFADFKIWTS
ncbi:polysaccharide lyase [Natronospora cellulosivora (SeqCode)]